MRVERLTVADDNQIRALVNLHIEAFPNFFLSSLGTGFLSVLYRSYLDDSHCACFVSYTQSQGAEKIVGSMVLLAQPASFYSATFRRKGMKFAIYAVPSLLRNTIPVAKKLISAIFYRGDVDDSSDFAGAGLISSICVSPEARGLGLGREMLKLGEAWANENNLKKIFLLTDRDNNDGVNLFYSQRGYKLHSVIKKSGKRFMNRYIKVLKD